jgi:hypothetical protein
VSAPLPGGSFALVRWQWCGLAVRARAVKTDRMTVPISIDPADGALAIGDGVMLTAFQRQQRVAPLVAPWQLGERDFGNGYAWLDLNGFTFGGLPANLSLCFAFGRLEQASWGVRLPGQESGGGWPSAEEIDEEIAFVRAELARQLGVASIGEQLGFDWGTVWSLYDRKGGLPAHGLRYGGG